MSLSGATIAFDLDGTLVETAPDLIGALNLLLDEHGLPALPVESARVLVGRGARYLIEHGFACAGEPVDADAVGGLVARFIEVYRGRIASESVAFDGVVETLDALAAAGARLVVCTNKRTDLSVALLDALALTDRFAAVVGADRAPAAKPDPRHVLAAIEAAGGDPSRAVMVGDSFNDVASAQAAGVATIVVSFGYTETPPGELGADALVDSFADIPAAAGALLAREIAPDRALPGQAPSAIGSRSRRADA